MVIEEIAVGCAGLASCIAGNIHALLPILIGGSEEQKNSFLPMLVGPNPAIMAFALTEPRGGSDTEKMDSYAIKDKAGYHIHGVKDFVVNGAIANYVMAYATTDPDAGKEGGRFFIIPASEIKETKVRNKMGLKYANTTQLVFENSLTFPDHVIGDKGVGYLILTQTLDYGHAFLGAIEVGIARSAYEMALSYANSRVQFGHPIISYQGVSFNLVDMATHIEAARLLVWKACWLMDQNEDYSKTSSMAKIFASEIAQAVTSKAIDLHGASGYVSQSMLNVYFRDAKAGSVSGGTNNIQRLIIAALL
jgi:alkylation response protein AidB-like acyl-CoA dehydrogenase